MKIDTTWLLFGVVAGGMGVALIALGSLLSGFLMCGPVYWVGCLWPTTQDNFLLKMMRMRTNGNGFAICCNGIFGSGGDCKCHRHGSSLLDVL